MVGVAYEGAGGPLAHLDLYRLGGMGGEDPGLLDPFFAPDTIAFVEWPECAPGAWPEERVAAPRAARARGRRRAGDRVILGIDTATAATAAAVLGAGRAGVRGARRSGARRAAAARRAACSRSSRRRWRAPAPAGRTSSGSPSASARAASPGLRHGIATARALAQGRGLPLAGVSSLEALARGAAGEAGERPVLAVIDARRGEVFAAAWRGAERLLEPRRDRARRAGREARRRAACRPPGRR